MGVNGPIVHEETDLTHIQGEALDRPCQVKVISFAGRNVGCVVESESFPRIILEKHRGKRFNISLASGPSFDVRLGSYDPNTVSRHEFKGTLIPVRCPCLVADKNAQIKSVHFNILNFSSFFEVACLAAPGNLTNSRNWEIGISRTITNGDRTRLRQEGGYGVTHDGTIQCSDGADFSVADVWHVLGGLSRFLSFSQGARCAVIRIRGQDTNGRQVPLVWGSTHVESWDESQGVLHTMNSGTEPLSSAWPGFLNVFHDKEKADTICRAIDWYLVANNSDFGSGLVIAQAGLELLAQKRTNQSTAEAIKEAVKRVAIDPGVPRQCKSLTSAASKYGWTTGPIAITRIRNDLVHANTNYPDLTPEAQLEARDLALWYMELLLLNRFNYAGRYKRRSTIGAEDGFASVPWVPDKKQKTGQ